MEQDETHEIFVKYLIIGKNKLKKKKRNQRYGTGPSGQRLPAVELCRPEFQHSIFHDIRTRMKTSLIIGPAKSAMDLPAARSGHHDEFLRP